MSPSKVQLGATGPSVPAMGLGLMGLNQFFYRKGEALPRDDQMGVLGAAHAAGQVFWDTADVYGDNEEMIGEWFSKTGRRADIILSTKFGCKHVDGESSLDSSPSYVKHACDLSLQRLRTDYIDVYFCQRADGKTPIEDTIKAMVDLKNAGKIRHLGMSQCSADSLRRAHAVHPIAAVQVEYSPFFLDSEANGLYDTAVELGIAILAYAPLGRGLGAMVFDNPGEIPATDLRAKHPRFAPSNWAKNTSLVRALTDVAARKDCTLPQLILAWAMRQRGTVVPLPGVTTIEQLREDLKAYELDITAGDDKEIRQLILQNPQSGGLYPHAGPAVVFADTPPTVRVQPMMTAEDMWITIS